MKRGWPLSSARMRISLGPRKPSTPTPPDSKRLASCTYVLPGPTILSTAGIVAVPKAIAAIAAAPPRAENHFQIQFMASGEDEIALAIFAWGRAHGDLLYARHLRGNSEHDQARRVSCLSTGEINACAIEWREAHPQVDPRTMQCIDCFGQNVLLVFTNLCDRSSQRVTLLTCNASRRPPPFHRVTHAVVRW